MKVEAQKLTRADVIKKWLCFSIDRWRVQKNIKYITPEDVIDYLMENGYLGGDKWDSFVDDVPEGWMKMS